VPIFFGLKLTEMRRFLEICKLTNVPGGEIICSYGEPSKKFFVLLEGKLDILSSEGVSLAHLEPVQTVGEMGIISKRPRVATVKAIGPVRLLEIGFQRLESLLDADVELRTRLYRNFIRVLSDRLSDTNDMAARYKRLYEEATGTGSALSAESIPPSAADSPGASQGSANSGAVEGGAHAHVATFFGMQRRIPDREDTEEGQKVVAELYEKGYSDADIEYAVKWTAHHIPTARRFSILKVSIQEALEDKWSI
jgi:CRP-like cAMP-binding protein